MSKRLGLLQFLLRNHSSIVDNEGKITLRGKDNVRVMHAVSVFLFLQIVA